jgi:nicotinate phosphoribosyltransferase
MRESSTLLTDLYELTMLHVYHEHGMRETAVFEFFVRKFPKHRNFLLAVGLEQVLDYLEQLQFSQDDIHWLRDTGRYHEDFLKDLKEFRFFGDVYAMREGTAFFPNEPILRVVAPLDQAQLVESRLMNILHLQTLIASKAIRCVLTAPDKLLIDFGMRRAHGFEAALSAARASYIAGFSGTATVLADKRYGVPSYGTMAHSFVQCHANEIDAFRRFAETERDNVVLLIDTYDTEEGARRVLQLADELSAEGITIKAVRLDSGDMTILAHRVRSILDAGGHPEIGIFCSGGLDEYKIEWMLSAEAPVDGFGVGTSLDVSADAPYLDCVYKLQEYAGVARRKRSAGKATWPGRKQVFRQFDSQGRMTTDILTVENDKQDGMPLLHPVMRDGRRLESPEPLQSIREHVKEQLDQLPDGIKSIRQQTDYPVQVSSALRQLADEVDRQFR